MIADNRPSPISRYRQKLDVVVFPVRWVVDAPFRFGRWVEGIASVQSHLVNQNADLKVRNLLLQSRLQKMMVLEKENKQLSSLLQGSSSLDAKIKLTRILAIQTNPEIQQCVLSTGAKDGVYVGQPVLDAFGVVGQVVSVGSVSSRVLLVSDKRSSVPVKDYRNGLRAVVSGTGDPDGLRLQNITRSTSIKKGDMFVSSGFALRFPVGYPVGVVTSVVAQPGARFLTVTLRPLAHLTQSEQLLLAWPAQAKLRQLVLAELKHPLPNAEKVEK